jgi:hypothetical protein
LWSPDSLSRFDTFGYYGSIVWHGTVGEHVSLRLNDTFSRIGSLDGVDTFGARGSLK